MRVCMHVSDYVFTARHDPGNVGERIGVTLQVRTSEQAPGPGSLQPLRC